MKCQILGDVKLVIFLRYVWLAERVFTSAILQQGIVVELCKSLRFSVFPLLFQMFWVFLVNFNRKFAVTSQLQNQR